MFRHGKDVCGVTVSCLEAGIPVAVIRCSIKYNQSIYTGLPLVQ